MNPILTYADENFIEISDGYYIINNQKYIFDGAIIFLDSSYIKNSLYNIFYNFLTKKITIRKDDYYYEDEMRIDKDGVYVGGFIITDNDVKILQPNIDRVFDESFDVSFKKE